MTAKPSDTSMMGAFVRNGSHWIPTKWFLSAISVLLMIDIAINAWQFVQYYTQGQTLANHNARIEFLERAAQREFPPKWLADRIDRIDARLQKLQEEIIELQKKIDRHI